MVIAYVIIKCLLLNLQAQKKGVNSIDALCINNINYLNKGCHICTYRYYY